MGDLLVATAALKELCEQFPKAQITVAGPKTWMQILWPSLWPQVSEIFVLEKNSVKGTLFFANKHLQDDLDFSFPHDLWKTSDKPATATSNEILIQDYLQDCDLFVNLRVESLRYAWPGRRAKYRLGTCPWPCKFLYTHWSPWLARDPIIHERDRMLEILEAPLTKIFPLGFSVENKQRLRFKQTGERGQKADKMSAIQKKAVTNSLIKKWASRSLPSLMPPPKDQRKNIILINPTASRWEKAWPKEKFRALALDLKKSLPQFEIQIIGAPNETDWLKAVAGNDFTIVQPGNFWLLQKELYLSRALITNTSSMQFFANACGLPTATLMGRTFPARWGPLGARDLILCGNLPQSKVQDVFQEDFLAYDSLQVQDVLQKATKWILTL